MPPHEELVLGVVLVVTGCSSPDPEPAARDATMARRCEADCGPTCGGGELACMCLGRVDDRCSDHVVGCPTALDPPRCTGSGGVECLSLRPGEGAERAICLLNTAPEHARDACRPYCLESDPASIACADWMRGGVACEGYVVHCPTSPSGPICDDYRVLCALPSGDLETPICVRQ